MTKSPEEIEARRRLRDKNVALFALLMGLVALFFAITVVRLKAGTPPAAPETGMETEVETGPEAVPEIPPPAETEAAP
jgi:hypothetical protein